MEEKKQQFDIELNREVAQGTYSNLSIISHSSVLCRGCPRLK